MSSLSSFSDEAAARKLATADLAPQDHIESLLSRCALRDERALEELYKAVSAPLYGLLVRMLRSRSVAEEALQDVMVKVWQHADQYAAYRGRAMAWLTSIARYRAIDLLRTQHQNAPLEAAPEAALADDTSTAANEAISSERQQHNLSDCMGRLNQDQQKCISLAYVEGYSHEQVARAVGAPLGTVKSWVRRGLLSLKRCLES
jgi:RNA polymerase sigma-70 factor (ECF subfamily)